MRSNNPVFSRNEEFARSGYAGLQSAPDTVSAGQLQDMYDRPAATPQQTGRMTIDDVVMRTAMLFGVLVVFAAGAWVLGRRLWRRDRRGAGCVRRRHVRVVPSRDQPCTDLLYAALEGIFVGAISRAYETAWSGVVPQAVLGTLAAFVGMLVLYRSGKLRATPKFTKVLVTATIGYIVIGLISLVTRSSGSATGGASMASADSGSCCASPVWRSRACSSSSTLTSSSRAFATVCPSARHGEPPSACW